MGLYGFLRERLKMELERLLERDCSLYMMMAIALKR